MKIEALKKLAAEKAVEQVKSGMVLGLGTGSTTRYAIIKIGEMWQSGELTDIVGVPTSEGTVTLANQYNIPMAMLNEYPVIDLAIDGADEVDPQLNLIKGLGGALLREKMIEAVVKRFIVVVDGTKVSNKLGTVSPLPVEVVQFSWKYTANWLAGLGCTPVIRGGEEAPFITDNGNYILHCHFPSGIDDPQTLNATLCAQPGVVENGLFLGMANQVIVSTKNGLQVLG